MSMHRFALGFFFASAIGASALIYGCSDDAAGVPPEPDAGNPTRRNDSGGSSSGGGDATTDAPAGTIYKAKATIAATGLPDSGAAMGTVDFTETNGTVAVAVSISGATPGQHGMHIHDGTSCANSTDPDAGAAGFASGAAGHWNPTDAGHGLPTAPSHHAGDLGNITIDGTGAGTLTLNMTGYNVQPQPDGGALSAIGHALVFHQGTDDGTTQPTGASGTRAGCGLIQPQ
jgi:superoxide dismutase, Cu-Zn family